MEAGSQAALLAPLGPTATWPNPEYGSSVLWVSKGPDDEVQFVLDQPYIYQPTGKPPKWVLLKRQGAADHSLHCRAVVRLAPAVPAHDAGPGNYAIVHSTHPHGARLYEIGWEIGPSGCGSVIEGRRIYVLRDKSGRWHVIGEGPAELSCKSGSSRCHRRSVRATVTWTGQTSAPVRISFVQTSLYTEVGEEPLGLADKAVHREAVLEGAPPAELKWLGREYLRAEEADTLETIVQRLSVWTIGWTPDRAAQRTKIRRYWRRAIRKLNPGLTEGPIGKDARVYLPSYAETAAALDHFAATAPATKPARKRPGTKTTRR